MSRSTLTNEFFQAIEEKDSTRIQEMLDQEPSLVNTENEHGLTALGMAAHFGFKEGVQLLIDAGADINALSHSKLSFIPSNTALHAAIAGNTSVEVVELLIRKGADVNAIDSNGHTPIQAAAFEGNLEVAKLLIENGADVSSKAGYGSAIAIATRNGKQEFVNLLRQHGATE